MAARTEGGACGGETRRRRRRSRDRDRSEEEEWDGVEDAGRRRAIRVTRTEEEGPGEEKDGGGGEEPIVSFASPAEVASIAVVIAA